MSIANIKTGIYQFLKTQLGTRQQVTVNFDSDFVTGNVVNAIINTFAINPVSFDTSHSQTLLNLAEELQKSAFVFKATVTGARQITLVATTPGQALSITGFLVTGGVAQPVATIAQIVAPVDVTVIFADQASPRPPAYPYAVVRVDSAIKIGWDETRHTDPVTFISTLGGQRRATVSINYFGTNAMDELFKAYNGLQKVTAQEFLRSFGLAVGDKNDVQNLTQLLESKWEERAFFDFFILYADNFEDDLGIIETVEIEGEIDGGKNGLVYTNQVIVGS